eukprot:15449511-Alexandrium_andersonii.AAC.1
MTWSQGRKWSDREWDSWRAGSDWSGSRSHQRPAGPKQAARDREVQTRLEQLRAENTVQQPSDPIRRNLDPALARVDEKRRNA